jgi:hypothetical protein
MINLLTTVIYNRLKREHKHQIPFPKLAKFCRRQGYTTAQIRKAIEIETVIIDDDAKYQLTSRVEDGGYVTVYLEVVRD